MARGQLFPVRASAVQRDRLFRPAVHGERQLDTANPEIVFHQHFGKDLVDGCDLNVASGLGERDRGRLIGKHIDEVFGRCRDQSTVRGLQQYPV